MLTCHYKAEARYDPNEDEWIVRLHRWAADMPDHAGTEYLGLCAANAKEEAEFIAASINRSIAFGLGDQLADCAAFFAGGVTDCFSKMEARDGQ